MVKVFLFYVLCAQNCFKNVFFVADLFRPKESGIIPEKKNYQDTRQLLWT